MTKAKSSTRKVNALLASFIPELAAGSRWTSLHAQAQAKELAGLLKQTGRVQGKQGKQRAAEPSASAGRSALGRAHCLPRQCEPQSQGANRS